MNWEECPRLLRLLDHPCDSGPGGFWSLVMTTNPRSGERSLQYCTACEFVPLEGGHWVLNEEPEATARLILDHFTAP